MARPMVEILTGLEAGDDVVTDMSDRSESGRGLGIAGRLTRAFIASPLTPLFILAALAVGLVALVSLPREEEPQISVPLVDIHLQAPGLNAEDAVKLVTEPMETIVKGIDGVEHVYSARPATTTRWSPPASWSAHRPTRPFCACMRNCAPTWTVFRSASPSRWSSGAGSTMSPSFR